MVRLIALIVMFLSLVACEKSAPKPEPAVDAGLATSPEIAPQAAQDAPGTTPEPEDVSTPVPAAPEPPAAPPAPASPPPTTAAS